jgi:hypothetical protein
MDDKKSPLKRGNTKIPAIGNMKKEYEGVARRTVRT